MESESHDQQSVEEANRQAEEEQVQAQSSLQAHAVEAEAATEAEAAFQPIYEFPAESQFSQAQENRPSAQEAGIAGMPLEEAVRRGLIYPPPPSFYQNMPEVAPHASLLPAWKQPVAQGNKAMPAAAPYPYRVGTPLSPTLLISRKRASGERRSRLF
jgi:hypothetical protein